MICQQCTERADSTGCAQPCPDRACSCQHSRIHPTVQPVTGIPLPDGYEPQDGDVLVSDDGTGAVVLIRRSEDWWVPIQSPEAVHRTRLSLDALLTAEELAVARLVYRPYKPV